MNGVVILTPPEMTLALMVGGLRQVTNLRDGRRDAHGARRDRGWQLHVEGAAGELAVAKALNLYWSGRLGCLRASDVGALQVRTTPCNGYRLVIHPEDPDDARFIFVVGMVPCFRLAGWLYASEGKRREWWDDPVGGRPAYFIPETALHAMDTLR